MSSNVLAEIWRGGQLESIHTGAYVVVDPTGKVVLSGGDIDRAVFPRSAIKIIQALPLVLDGVADGLGLTPAELALACASHSGLPLHTETASGMLAKAHLGIADLECGAHWPTQPQAARVLASGGGEPTALHNNCSGKHAGFLCTAMFKAILPGGYVGADHPIMQRVLECVETVLAVDLSRTALAIDGCSIPTYPIPLHTLATGFARLASGVGLPQGYAEATLKLRNAVAAHPLMIAGPGQFDTLVTKRFGGAVFVKSGAEGVCCGAVPHAGLGFAVKCNDGAGRGTEAAVAALLQRILGESPFLEGLSSKPLHNWNGSRVGSIVAAIS